RTESFITEFLLGARVATECRSRLGPGWSYLFSTDAYTPKTYREPQRRAGVALWSRAGGDDYVLRRRRVLSQSHRPGEGSRHLYHRPEWRNHHLERGVHKREWLRPRRVHCPSHQYVVHAGGHGVGRPR